MKSNRFVSEEQKEVIRFIKILLIVVVVVVAVYFATRIFVTKDLLQKDTEPTVQAGSVDYSVTILGAAFNRPESEYYVMAYDSTSVTAAKYATMLSRYVGQEEHEKVYFADLNNHMNKEYYSKEKSNPNATNVSELKVGDFTLFQIKNGKIVSYIEDYEKALEVLAVKK